MILVIDNSKKNATEIADMFFYMGVLAKGTTLQNGFSEISNVYRAVILLSPERFPDCEDYVKRLREYDAKIPIFAIGSPEESAFSLFAHVFPRSSYPSTIMLKILDYTIENDLPIPGDYRLMGMDLSCDLPSPVYFETPLKLTKTESMIVRYLVRTYPNPTSAEDILNYAFKESRTPELSNVRTHISIINKKFRDITDRNLIEMSFGKGYRILTPEVAEALV